LLALALPWGSPWGFLRQAAAQLGQIGKIGSPAESKQPVVFVADGVAYDKEHNLVTASGRVEAWQGDRVLRADRIIFDRTTNIAAASGHVVLMEPDGQVIFADYAELTQDMKEGVLSGMRGLLAENGKIAANGARRTGGTINEMSRVVYTTCDLCKEDPTKPPVWQMRARAAVQDNERKRIEYEDATLELLGVPVFYTPFFSHPDPSVKRASGLLIPSVGASTHLGFFGSLPYYMVIDGQTDATVTPMFTTKAGQQLGLEVRHRFNTGEISVAGTINNDHGKINGSGFGRGRLELDENWRTGFDFARASNSDYVRDFHLGRFAGGTSGVLPSQVFLEGFGQGAYLRLDSKFYQSMSDNISQSQLPQVMPRFQYSLFGPRDSLGGRFSFDAGAFNVRRVNGTDTRRGNATLEWERPFTGQLGDLWKVTFHLDTLGYAANDLQLQPNFLAANNTNIVRAQPQVALEARWPFMRDAGAWGAQIIEPIVQVVAGPNVRTWQNRILPNEDSLDLQFTDANLFGFNHYPGVDRLEGGFRANVGLHTAWYLGGMAFDGIIGQSYRTETNTFPPGSGMNGNVSDIVARATLAPTEWMDVTYRTRMDNKNWTPRLAEAVATFGKPAFRVAAGYIYTDRNPYSYYTSDPKQPQASFYTPRNEITIGASSSIGNIRLSGFGRRDLATQQMVAAGASAAYEDECFIFDVRFQRRFTGINNDHGATAVLFQMTFKPIGQLGFRAM